MISYKYGDGVFDSCASRESISSWAIPLSEPQQANPLHGQIEVPQVIVELLETIVEVEGAGCSINSYHFDRMYAEVDCQPFASCQRIE